MGCVGDLIGLGSSVLIDIVSPHYICWDVVSSCLCWASSLLSSTDLVIPPDASLGLVVALQGGVVLHRASMPCLVIQERPRALVRHVNFGRPGLKPSQDAPAASFIVPLSVG